MQVIFALSNVVIWQLSLVLALPQAETTRGTASSVSTASVSTISPSIPTSSADSQPSPTFISSAPSVYKSSSTSTRNIIIAVVCSVGIAAIALASCALWFCVRRSKRKREALAINDDEIKRWQNVSQHRSQYSTSTTDSIINEKSKHKRTKSYTAPNAVPGLTDEAVPGQPAFIPPPLPTRTPSNRLKKSFSYGGESPRYNNFERPRTQGPPPVIPEIAPRDDQASLNLEKRSIRSVLRSW